MLCRITAPAYCTGDAVFCYSICNPLQQCDKFID